jgi:hypothetical protein
MVRQLLLLNDNLYMKGLFAPGCISKITGSTDVKLCKKDTALVYHFYCGGKPM